MAIVIGFLLVVVAVMCHRQQATPDQATPDQNTVSRDSNIAAFDNPMYAPTPTTGMAGYSTVAPNNRTAYLDVAAQPVAAAVATGQMFERADQPYDTRDGGPSRTPGVFSFANEDDDGLEATL